MYDTERTHDNCASDCFTVFQQNWSDIGNALSVFYKDMKPNCLFGQKITVKCPGFRNPIEKKKVTNFEIRTYDLDGK